MASSASVLVMARIALMSLTSSRPRISASVDIGSAFLCRCRWFGAAKRSHEMGDELLPRRSGREGRVERLEQEEAEADRVAERHEGLGGELGADAAAGLGRLDDGGEPFVVLAHALAEQRSDGGIA